MKKTEVDFNQPMSDVLVDLVSVTGLTLPQTLDIHGLAVPIGDYETLRRLEHIAFGLTPGHWLDRKAHRVAVAAAVTGLEAMRRSVRLASIGGRKR